MTKKPAFICKFVMILISKKLHVLLFLPRTKEKIRGDFLRLNISFKCICMIDFAILECFGFNYGIVERNKRSEINGL